MTHLIDPHPAFVRKGLQAMMGMSCAVRHSRFSLSNLGRHELTSLALILGTNNQTFVFLESPFFGVNVWCVELFLQR